jgi:hypothetical protein
MYGFDESGRVQSEKHRRQCFEWIDQECLPSADENDTQELTALRHYLETAPIAGLSSIDKLDEFTRAYVETALWSSNDNSTESGGEPLDANYSIEDIAPDTLAQMVDDCRKFQAAHGHLLTDEHCLRYGPDFGIDGRAGHDFWLTRNGHGAGFWDGDWSAEADAILTPAAEAFGELDLYVGDDGRIYS